MSSACCPRWHLYCKEPPENLRAENEWTFWNPFPELQAEVWWFSLPKLYALDHVQVGWCFPKSLWSITLKKKKSIVLCGCVLDLWRITVLFRRPWMTSMWAFSSQHLRSHPSPVTCRFRIFHTNQIMLVLPISLEVEPLGFHASRFGT